MQDRNILGLNALLAVSALAFVGMTGGCKNAASNVPDSKIVLAVESAGAGHLKDVSGDAIQSWLGQHSDVAKQISADCKTAYRMHKADILNRIEVRNPSQLDWMIAVRMRLTGHDQQAIAQAMKENASQGRESENRNWANYAERTAEAVFGPRGDRESARSEQRAEAWARVEGRDLARERQVQPIQNQKVPRYERGDFERD